MLRGDGPFIVLEKINDNAYKIELLGNDYVVSNTFNVADLSPIFLERGRMMGISPIYLLQLHHI